MWIDAHVYVNVGVHMCRGTFVLCMCLISLYVDVDRVDIGG